MGVPRLFPWLKREFNKNVKHFPGKYVAEASSVATTQKNVDYLYLDSNGLLHNAAQKVFNYGSGKMMIDRYDDLSYNEKLRTTFEIYFDLIKEVYEMMKPEKCLYIAIDGPAPLAKQAQQRQRRFVAAKERVDTLKNFDSNCISPGTAFMNELDLYLRYRIRLEMNRERMFQSISVIYSPPSVPGEGEHKIMDYIRSLSEEEKNNASHCMFGPDGDLIMLTLAAHLPKISLFRHDIYHKGFFHLLDMGGIRKAFPSQMGMKTSRRSRDDVTNDFIVMGMFVGNDFLPKIQMFHLLEDGLDVMFKIYKDVSNRGSVNPLTVSNHMNLSGLKTLINRLKISESCWLIDQVLTKSRFKEPPLPMFVNQTLKSCVSEKDGEAKLDYTAYRKKYYEKAGEKDVKTLCHDYLKTLIWVFEYYVNGLPDWRWAYEHHYAPLMDDFAEYISALNEEEFREISTFTLKNASLPFEQLLSILPPISSNLLPPAYGELSLSPDSILVKAGFYPLTFDIDYEGKLKEYQGVALLPFVQYETIRVAVSDVKGLKTYSRNKFGKVYTFLYDKKYLAKYSSRYGTIDRISVRCTK